jgi:hypothetical protein
VEENKTRTIWVETLVKTASPVFDALSIGKLRERMPVETHSGAACRDDCSHLEAVGRSLAGIAPWLELTDEACSERENQQRLKLREQVKTSLSFAVDRNSPDCLNFHQGNQPLVDAAFLALGLMRSWDKVWSELPASTQDAIIEGLTATRRITPGYNNWLLFSATIETFLCRAGQRWDRMRVDYALREHALWYKGDGVYGDGPDFHWDYYNSFVIQPMLYEIVHTSGELGEIFGSWRESITTRGRRFAAIQERMICPDGTFPAIGRSLTYRFGAFHHLSLMVLKGNLPSNLRPASIRCALTAAMKKTMHTEGTYSQDGWLQIGLCGHQPSLGEGYISTGSLYLTLCGFLPLGLPCSHPFWADPDADWTSKQIWSGSESACECDHALED